MGFSKIKILLLDRLPLCAIKKMKIQKDNLNPKQKKKAYLTIFFLLLIFCSFFIYKLQINNKRDYLLSNNTEITECRIIGINTHNNRTNIVNYTVDNKTYRYEMLVGRELFIGEFYEIKYSKTDPNFAEVNYTKPIISKKTDYERVKAMITETFENNKVSFLTFSYEYSSKKYERILYIEKINGLKKNMKIEIIVNKMNPKISYLKKQINNVRKNKST
jgi:hypothetical protein